MRLVSTFFAFWLLLLSGSACSGESPTPLSQYVAVDFTDRPGRPLTFDWVQADANGLLWIMSGSRLYRFDGMRHIRYGANTEAEDLATRPRSFIADPRGGIWLGYLTGGAVFVEQDRFTRYDEKSGLPAGAAVTSFAVNGDRVIAATAKGIFELRNGQWTMLVGHRLLEGKFIDDVEFDLQGGLWAKTPDGVFHQAEGAASFSSQPLPPGDSVIGGLVVSPAGRPWLWSMSGQTLCRLDQQKPYVCWKAPGVSDPKFDRDGNLWWADNTLVHRVRDADNLDASSPNSLDRNREERSVSAEEIVHGPDGSVWLGNDDTLIRLRLPVIERMPLPYGGLLAQGNDVWVLSFVRGMMRTGATDATAAELLAAADGSQFAKAVVPASELGDYGPVSRVDVPIAVLEQHKRDLYGAIRIERADDGNIYIARLTPPSLIRWTTSSAEAIPLPEMERGANIRRVQTDVSGRVWVTLDRGDVVAYALDNGAWRPYGGYKAISKPGLVGLGLGVDGRYWLADGNEAWALGQVDAQRFGVDDGLSIGLPRRILQSAGLTWMLGTRGIAILTKNRFVAVTGLDGDRFEGATDLMHDPGGDLYLNGADGVSRIRAEDWKRVLSGKSDGVPFVRFDRWDGVRWPPMHAPGPSIARTSDGTLWFSRAGGLMRLLPGGIASRTSAPKVIIAGLEIDDRPSSHLTTPILGPGAHRLNMHVLTAGAERPEKIRLRYRTVKDDVEDDWRFLGEERILALDLTGAGTYEIHIQASDENGVWLGQVTAFKLGIKPMYYQTTWFHVLVAALAVGAITAMYSIRMRGLRNRMQIQMATRIRERERIARDLHDTLLQGTQGMLLNFQALASRLPAGDALRQRMEAVLDRTQDVVREGRDRIHLLRDPEASTTDLAECLQRHAQDCAAEHGLVCNFDVSNSVRPLDPIVYEEVRQVAQEAITNACLHSRGTRIDVSLEYGEAELLLFVRDDGVGVAADRLKADRHWGLSGMRERASLIGATFSIEARRSGGTEVRLSVRAGRAYSVSK